MIDDIIRCICKLNIRSKRFDKLNFFACGCSVGSIESAQNGDWLCVCACLIRIDPMELTFQKSGKCAFVTKETHPIKIFWH